MKQVIFFLALLSGSLFVHAQTWSLSGNAGTTPGTDFLGTTDNQRLVLKTNNTEKFTILGSGNAGIGTTSPRSNLEVAGTIIAGGQNTAYLLLGTNGNNFPSINTNLNPIKIGSAGNEMLVVGASAIGIGVASPAHALDVNGDINTNGKVLIGSTLLKAGSFSLAVNGDAIFNRAVVRLYGNWPDYVFDKDYILEPLDKVEAYIRANKHLKGIPSQEAISAEGIDMGESQKILTEKVEELTLYLIEQNKIIQQLQAEVLALKQTIN